MENIIRRSNERGFFDHGWLKTYHTFSFDDYYDPNFMGFGNLRVINDDVISANTGFPMHPHKNMEIVTYILDGTLTHSDNLGNKEDIKSGEVQIMSVGENIIHSEWNYTGKDCHLLQVWIKPNKLKKESYYKIYKPDHFEKWAYIELNKDDDSNHVYIIDSGELAKCSIPNEDNELVWIHVGSGSIKINDITLNSGDGFGFTKSDFYNEILFLERSRVLVFFI